MESSAKQLTQEETKRPSVVDYLDYRKFLLDYYLYKKAINPKFSYRLFARIAGMKSLNYLKMIVSGKRNLTDVLAKQVGLCCDLKTDELKYFIALVHWNQCDNENGKEAFWNQVLQNRPRKDVYELADVDLRILVNWKAIALMEMVHLKDFRLDPEWIVSKFRGKITQDEVNDIFNILLGTGLVKNENGKVTVKSDVMFTGGEIPSSLIQMYHKQVAEEGVRALGNVAVNSREFAASTLSVKAANVAKLKEAIKEFQRKCLEYTDCEEITEADAIYQLNIQFFPLTGEGDQS